MNFRDTLTYVSMNCLFLLYSEHWPRALRRVSLLILSDLFPLAEVRWLPDIGLWKGESQIVWILHVHVGQYWPKMLNVCIPAQCTLSEAPSQAAGYPPHPSPQSGELHVQWSRINRWADQRFFFRIQWSNLKYICLRNSLICKSYLFLFWVLNIISYMYWTKIKLLASKLMWLGISSFVVQWNLVSLTALVFYPT